MTCEKEESFLWPLHPRFFCLLEGVAHDKFSVRNMQELRPNWRHKVHGKLRGGRSISGGTDKTSYRTPRLLPVLQSRTFSAFHCPIKFHWLIGFRGKRPSIPWKQSLPFSKMMVISVPWWLPLVPWRRRPAGGGADLRSCLDFPGRLLTTSQSVC